MLNAMLNNNLGEGYQKFKKAAELIKKGITPPHSASKFGAASHKMYSELSKEELEAKIKTAEEFLKKIGPEDKRFEEANRRYMVLEDRLAEKIFGV